MAPEKVTQMVLNVDLKCSGCYKKVKKVICKIPRNTDMICIQVMKDFQLSLFPYIYHRKKIRDQVFDVDKNKVKIVVVCCDPEKIRDKLCYKGCGSIQSIEIIEKPKEADKPKTAADKPKETDKPKPAGDKPKEAPKPAGDKPKEADKSKPAGDKPKPAGDKQKEADKPKPAADKPKEAEKPKPAADKPKQPEKPKPADKPKDPEKPKPTDKPKDSGKPPEAEKAKPKDAEKPKEAGPPKKPDGGEVAKMVYEPVHGYPQMYPPSAYPMMGYGQYYDQGYGYGYGMPVAPPPPPPPHYGGFGYDHGYTGYNGYNENRSHYTSNDYVEEEGEGCSIM